MRFLLDTDICVFIARQKPLRVHARLAAVGPADLAISVVTYFELIYGAWKSQRPEANLAVVDRLRQSVLVLPLGPEVAPHYGSLRAALEREGAGIGYFDTLIAAHAVSLGLILVTNNTREFSRVKGLKLENWAD